MNEKKRKIMTFGRRKYSDKLNCTLNKKVLDIVDDFKYLGLTFSRTGTIKKCTNYIYKNHKEPCFVYLKIYD